MTPRFERERRRTLRSRLMGLAVLVMLGFTVACTERISLANYELIKVGQAYDEVTRILGEPARCDETLGVRQCEWGDPQRGISVKFVASKVLLTQARNLH